MQPLRNEQKKEQPSTYFVEDRQNEDELARLTIQDQMLTNAMGGVLPEQSDPTAFRRVLDVACGTGGWLIEMAQTFPTMMLVGIDISKRMIDYAREQAAAAGVADRIEFLVNDATLMLEFPSDYFDLTNLRAGSSFLRTWDWRKMLSELFRVTHVGGVIRVTDAALGGETSSPALARLTDMLRCAFYRSGHYFTDEAGGVTDHLERLLVQHCGQHVYTRSYVVEFRAGTEQGKALYNDIGNLYRTARPFIKKWGCITDDYDTLCQQAQNEMQRPDFYGRGTHLTAWHIKSSPPSQRPRIE